MHSPFSRRRRATFGLFGSRARRQITTAPMKDESQDMDAGVSARGLGALDQEQVTVDTLIARLCGEVLNDQRLRDQASEQELVQLTRDAVRSLWDGSPVKTFIAVLAMRQVRERLAMSETTGDADRETSA